MARESKAARAARAGKILRRLEAAYPDAHCALDHVNAYQLLVATILSAQCTDARVNQVTPAFFARFPDAAALAAGTQEEVEELIRSTGFFRNKAKNLLAMAAALVEKYNGSVPDSMDQLRELPGVGRKTANVILGNAFGRNDGITVDTHVGRIARLLRLTTATDPEKVEQDLMPLFPRPKWTLLSHLLISHGRAVCIARRPECGRCPIATLCPSAKAAPRG
jgi:endonuclease-3